MAEHIPYGRQSINEEDIRAVVDTLKGDWLTTGPAVERFEQELCRFTGASHMVAVSSGTAALHAAMNALGIAPGDEVIVPAITFAATANAVLYQGGTPVICDVLPDSLLIDPAKAAALTSPRTKAIVAVDYGGQTADYSALRAICRERGLSLVADACHSIGGAFHGERVGTIADLSCFSFHPVKHITTCEGGAVATANSEWAKKMRRFRNHGISTDHRQRELLGSWFYEVETLGFNYRLNDLQCALGISQLGRIGSWLKRRREIASAYREAFSGLPGVTPLSSRSEEEHAYHLFVARVRAEEAGISRDGMFKALRAQGIMVNVHYVPLHLHPLYRERLGTFEGQCPVAEAAYEEILSLPMYGTLSDAQLDRVIGTVAAQVRR